MPKWTVFQSPTVEEKFLYNKYSNFSVPLNPEGLLKHRLQVPTHITFDIYVWSRAQQFAFPTNYQIILMVQSGDHAFENLSCRRILDNKHRKNKKFTILHDVTIGENWQRVNKISLHYFLQPEVKLQLSKSKQYFLKFHIKTSSFKAKESLHKHSQKRVLGRNSKQYLLYIFIYRH